MIYVDFENILVPEFNGKQNPDESYTNKYQKHVACSYDYKLVCVGNKFSKPFKLYLGEDAVYIFIINMIKESKFFSDVMNKYFNKELVIAIKMMKTFKPLLNVGFVIIYMLMLMLK